MQFQNIERKQINRLFNYFLPVDACCCGCSLEFALQTIISLQAIITFFYLIQVITNIYVPGIFIGTFLAVLVYNGIQGLKKRKNFMIYFWIMKILFFIGIIEAVCLLLFIILLLFSFKVYLNSPESVLLFFVLTAAFIAEFLIQLYCLILIHSYYVRNYENQEIAQQFMDQSLFINQYPQMQVNQPLNIQNQQIIQIPTYIAHESLDTSVTAQANQYPLVQKEQMQGQSIMIMPFQNQPTYQYTESQKTQHPSINFVQQV